MWRNNLRWLPETIGCTYVHFFLSTLIGNHTRPFSFIAGVFPVFIGSGTHFCGYICRHHLFSAHSHILLDDVTFDD